jgi:hypothetical protein
MLDAAFQLLREHTRPLFVLSAILVIPGIALGVVNSLVFGDMLRPNAAMPFAAAGRVFTVLLPAMTLWVCWFMIAFGALVWAASVAYMEGRDADPMDGLRAAFARAGTLVGGGLLTWLLLLVQLVGMGIALAIVIGVGFAAVSFAFGALQSPNAGAAVAVVLAVVMFVAVFVGSTMLIGRYAALPGVIMHEAVGAKAAMRRARELSRGSLRRIAGVLLLVTVLFFVVSLGVIAVFAFVTRSQIVAQVLASIANVPLYALTGTLMTVLYYDLRVRAEGLDIELLAEELDALPREAAP